MDKVILLRNLADHIINLTRQSQAFQPLQFSVGKLGNMVKQHQTDSGKEPDPELLFDEIIQAPEVVEGKEEFLELTREKAEKLCEIIGKFDTQPKTGPITGACLWHQIKEILKRLKFFFMDLKDKSPESIQQFSAKLKVFINDFRSRIGLQSPSFFNNSNCLDEMANISEIIKPDNFVDGQKGYKKETLIEAMKYINELNSIYSHSNVQLPENLAEALVDMSELESRLHTCIDKIINDTKLQLISQLRCVEDYAIRFERRKQDLKDIQVISHYKDESSEPAELLEKLIEDKAAGKQEFLNLIHKKVAKISELTGKLEEQLPDTLQKIWGTMKNTPSIFKNFFLNLKNKTKTGFEALSQELERVINYIKSLKIDSNVLRRAEKVNGAYSLILRRNEQEQVNNVFSLVDDPKQRLRDSLLSGIGYQSLAEEKYHKLGVPSPENFVRKFVETAEIDARLYICIGKLAAV